MAQPLPPFDDLSRPYKSRRSFDYTPKEMTRNMIRLENALKFNQEVLPRLMNLPQGQSSFKNKN